jgi:hypothetical protein
MPGEGDPWRDARRACCPSAAVRELIARRSWFGGFLIDNQALKPLTAQAIAAIGHTLSKYQNDRAR